MSLSAEDLAFLAKIGQDVTPTETKKPTAAKKDEE
jgi:hypothetical protein